jgi:plasmid stabilization system protein ParE
MALKIIWTQTAWNDLEDTAILLRRIPGTMQQHLFKKCEIAARSLTNFAERGRVVPEFNDDSIRELFIRSHRLIYKISDKTVYILAIYPWCT